MSSKKWYKSWAVHNLFGHPLMQLFNSIGKKEWATAVHDGTLPPIPESKLKAEDNGNAQSN